MNDHRQRDHERDKAEKNRSRMSHGSREYAANDKLRDTRDHSNTAPSEVTAPCASVLSFGPREKAGGHHAADLLLQLPAPASPVPRFHASKSDLNEIKILRCECEPHH